MSSIPAEFFNAENLATEGKQVPEWLARPFSLVSLLDMERFYAHLFVLSHLHVQQVTARIASRGGEEKLTKADKEYLEGQLSKLTDECKKAGLLDSWNHLISLRGTLWLSNEYDCKDLKHVYGEIERVIGLELCKTLFMRMPKDHAEYYQKEELFGEIVKAKFPEANKEITEAGNCFATGNYTACVFHLMRVVEYGARVLARQLRITSALPFPVELCEWGVIYRELNAAVGRLRSRTSVSQSNTHAYYSHAVAQFGNFKDAWRNKVSHTQASYNQNIAKDIMDNSRQFMQHLAIRLGRKKSAK